MQNILLRFGIVLNIVDITIPKKQILIVAGCGTLKDKVHNMDALGLFCTKILEKWPGVDEDLKTKKSTFCSITQRCVNF